jgi:hypothetical protein
MIMSVTNPAFRISRQPVGNNVAHYVAFLTPPIETIPLPEKLRATNPVPDFMESIGIANVRIPRTISFDLMHKEELTMWDGTQIPFFLFRWPDLRSPFNKAVYPAPTLRVPRGVIFHGFTHGHGPPPHTIHWHGIEPTPMNDGVGHCTTEVGDITYQWQPNFIGTYFYHCHRNTVQHFEFGLVGALIVEPPDAFEQGAGRNPGGYPRRTGANLKAFPQFPGFINRTLRSGDAQAKTVPYDVEALWVLDGKDSRWHRIMEDPRAGLAQPGNRPGVNDRFEKGDFHDYNSDYWFVTGVPFPGRLGGTATAAANVVIPREFNCGVEGMQVSVNARVNQTILIRIIATAYDFIVLTLPLDAVVISVDGRTLGVEPRDLYSRPFLMRAGALFNISNSQRFELLIRTSTPINSFATVQFRNARDNSLRFTGRIPIRIR